LFGVSSADGYDGGVLPLKRYVDLEELFLPAGELSPDGRLRDHLRAIPDARLLALLNVEYAIIDKNSDVWLDNVYYDTAFESPISRTLALPLTGPIVATAAGLISRVEGLPSLADGTVVAQVIVTGDAGQTTTVDVVAGKHTALQGQATDLRRVDHPVAGQYVQAVLPMEPIVARSVSVRYMLAAGYLALRGLSLIDQRTDASESLPVSADFRIVHSGDVKIYRNLRVLPRAYAVHSVRVVEGGQRVAQTLREPTFVVAEEAVVEQPLSPALQEASSSDSVSILVDEPERVVIGADMAAAGLLVLTDAYYPGWQAAVDGSPAPILRANGMFRGIVLAGGKHRVELSYRPRSLFWGGMISLAAVAISAAMMALPAVERLRNRRRRLHEVHD
jgi:hypothetical protein